MGRDHGTDGAGVVGPERRVPALGAVAVGELGAAAAMRQDRRDRNGTDRMVLLEAGSRWL